MLKVTRSRRMYVESPYLCFIISLFTAIVGAEINKGCLGRWFFVIIDFLFWPIVWTKWVIFNQVNIQIIKQAFERFL